jgi:hypothetical protein
MGHPERIPMDAEMTGAELACMRTFLGFSPSQLADYLWEKLPERPEFERPDPRTESDLLARIKQWEQQIEATHQKIAETHQLIATLADHGAATIGDLPKDLQPERPRQSLSGNLLRRIQRMERGEAAVPFSIVDEIEDMYEVATNLVNNLVVQYKKQVKNATDGEDVVLYTQQDGDTSGRYPACWHRAVAARVAAAVPGIIIEYKD